MNQERIPRATNINEKAADLAGDWQSGISTRVAGLDKAFRDFVKAKPAVVAACAVGLGFAASLIFNKRNTPTKVSNP